MRTEEQETRLTLHEHDDDDDDDDDDLSDAVFSTPPVPDIIFYIIIYLMGTAVAQ